MIYFDTAFLVKLLIEEPGSEHILAFVRKKNVAVCSSIVARMETASALHRKLQEGTLSRAALKKVETQLTRDVDRGRVVWLPLADAVVDRVHNVFRRLPAKTYLRTGDAVHLATASEAGLSRLYSNDRHLLLAAGRFRLKGINPLAP